MIALVVAVGLCVLLQGVLAGGGSIRNSPGGSPSVASGGQDWTTYLHDAERTASSNHGLSVTPANDSQLTQRWNYSTGGVVAAQAVVANGTVYVGSWTGYEYALSAGTGKLEWSTYLGVHPALSCRAQVGITSTATLNGSTLYLGGGNADWYALNATSGRVVWSTNVTEDVSNLSGSTVPLSQWEAGLYNWASPLIYNGNAYVGIASDCDDPLVPGGLLEIPLSGQNHNGSHFFLATPPAELGGSVWASPSVDAATNTIFVGTGNPATSNASGCLSPCPYVESLVALNATTLAVLNHWQVPVPDEYPDGDFGTTPTLAAYNGGTYVVLTNKNGWTYAFNALNATPGNPSWGPVWSTLTSETPTTSSAAYAVVGGNPLIFVGNKSGAVWALNLTNGQPVWTQQFVGRVFGAPAYSNGVLVVTDGGSLRALDAATGGGAYKLFTCPSPLYASPSLAEGAVFEGCTNGVLYAFGTATTGTGTVYSVSGRVVGSSGNPINLAAVAYSGSGLSGTTSSDSAGYFMAHLPNGSYVLTASGTGYTSVSKDVTVSGANVVAGRFTLSPSGTPTAYEAAGRVVNSSGDPIVGATISTLLNGSTTSVLTNGMGYFVIYLPNGSYELTISAAGYVSQTTSVTVAGANVFAGHFVLAVVLT